MQRSSSLLTTITIGAALFVGNAVAQNNPQSPAPTTKSAAKPAQHAASDNDGQRVFDQNCSRCHTTPDGFSPRISGTIARHMRIRASLSQADEQALIRFLNP